MSGTAVERVFRREGIVVLASLVPADPARLAFLLAGAGTGMDPFAMSGWLMPLARRRRCSPDWTALYWLIAFCMWVGMMVAMMLPSASPMVLLYARVARHAERQGRASRARRLDRRLRLRLSQLLDSFQPVGCRRSVGA